MSTHKLWPTLDPALCNEILSGVQAEHKKLYRTALDVLAPVMKLRAAKILELPKLERHTKFAHFLAHPQFEPLSLNVFGFWLMTRRREMLTAWLDALGFEHDGSGVLADIPPCPPREVVAAAVDQLLVNHPPDEVRIHLTVFNQAEDAQWEVLREVMARDPRFSVLPMPTGAGGVNKS